jgi:putative flippase GtrA
MSGVYREVFAYAAASSIALVVDVATLSTLVEIARWNYLTAAATAFLAGTVVIYALSISRVFRQRRLRNRSLEFTVFAMIGVAGCAASLLVMFLSVHFLGLHYLVGKGLSVGVTFAMNFGLRRLMLFTAKPQKDYAISGR